MFVRDLPLPPASTRVLQQRRPIAARRRRLSRPRRAFSLIEALIALSITAMAGAVLLLSVDSSLQSTGDAVERTIADGVAQRLLDEILTRRFVDVDENSGSGGSSVLGL